MRMKRILCICIVMLLTGCSAPEPGTDPSRDCTHGVYEFTFTVERLSGRPSGDWDFVYTYNGKTITSGHRILFPLEIFSFHSIQVDVIEKDAPDNKYTAAFPTAVCDGGSGTAEITVTGSDGKTAVFKILCDVDLVGSR